MAYAPTLTTFTDAAPCPRVEVFFDSFAPGTASVTVFRLAAGREYRVRGAVRAATAGTLTRIDFECPFNVLVTYRAEMFDAAGLSLGFTDSAELGDILVGLAPGDDVVPADDLLAIETISGTGLVSLHTWLHNPLNPAGAVKVELAASTAGAISRPVVGEVSRPRGRSVGVMLSESRLGVQGLRFDVRALDLDTADKVQALIGGYGSPTVPVICVRMGGTDSRVRLPKPLFLGVLDIAELDMNVAWGGSDTIQEMTGDEVDPPVPGLFIPLLTAADINAYYASAADLNSDNLTGSAVNRRYDLAGFATA